ncbi:hypothetical protein IHE44_0010215, partial [Lamprotornis superbus]
MGNSSVAPGCTACTFVFMSQNPQTEDVLCESQPEENQMESAQGMEPAEEQDAGNHTLLTEFVLSGLSSRPELQHLLFFTICFVYSMALIGNLLICMVTVHPTLHTPMYFFLRVLSFLDISTASVVVPKMLVSLLSEDRSISYLGCVTQLYCVVFLAATEWYLLAAMAYDRYVAVCWPLSYAAIMSPRLCLSLRRGSQMATHRSTVIAMSKKDIAPAMKWKKNTWRKHSLNEITVCWLRSPDSSLGVLTEESLMSRTA